VTSEQSRYQVRFDFGVEGAAAIGSDADVLVWVDTIPTAPLDLGALPSDPAIIEASFDTAPAAAAWILTLQQHLRSRITIAIVAAGDRREGGGIRFSVEDQLAAGAVIDGLAALGIDAVSPEAAAAEGAFVHLRAAVRHLVTASVTAAAGNPPAGDSLKPRTDLGPEDIVVTRHHPRA
jgi:hypothetical protein